MIFVVCKVQTGNSLKLLLVSFEFVKLMVTNLHNKEGEKVPICFQHRTSINIQNKN